MNWIKAHVKALAAVAIGLLIVVGVLWNRCGIHGCPDVGTLKGYMPDEASTLVDYRGREVGKLYLTKRVIVQIDSLPEYVPNAFVAMEDQRFYKHHGVDWVRVFGALFHDVKSGGIEEGSSTITMQLARNAFPDKLPANHRTVWRKIAEMHVARKIEHQYTKKEILQLYLNQIYFGSGAYGIEAASEEYFGHPAAKLSLAEAAMLAALPRAPSKFNPRSNKDLAYEGRKEVLSRMADQKLIGSEEAEKATKSKVRLRRGAEKNAQAAPYFVEAVRDVLEDQLGDAIYSQGYTIYTTLDVQLQKTLEQELEHQARAIEAGAFGSFRHPTLASALNDTTQDDKGTPYLQAAAVFMDPRTGDVRALVGGRNFEDSEYNRALYAQRQPGSAFKPFVYAAAFAQGYAPTYRLIDQPLRIVLSRHQVWEPKNYGGGYHGAVSLRDALAHSMNVPTVRLAMEIGIDRVVDMARQMGITGHIPSVPSVALGTAEVTPMDLIGAYAAFANLGPRPTMPRYVTKVVDRSGNVVWSQEPETKEVIDAPVAFETVSLMEDVVDRGTATAVRAVGYTDPAAGKTGTTQDAGDIWFVGLTPNLIGTIWMGFDKRQTIVASATGGDLVSPVWGRVMVRMNERSQGWAPPPGIEMHMVDANGNVMGDNCPASGATRREYFIQGTAPVTTCYPSYDQYTMNDTLGYMTDTSSYTPQQDEGWWSRLRSRIFGNSQQPQPAQTEPVESDTGPVLRGTPVQPTTTSPATTAPLPPATVPAPTTRPEQNPTPNPNPATQPPPIQPKPKAVPYDSIAKPKPDTTQHVKPDSLENTRLP